MNDLFFSSIFIMCVNLAFLNVRILKPAVCDKRRFMIWSDFTANLPADDFTANLPVPSLLM